MKQNDILGSVRVASPCKASWDNMEGDYRVRHCEACRHKVYNLSGMTRVEAETLVAGTEGRLCVRFYRRADGTMLTQDCPVGVTAARKRLATTVACAGVFLLSLYSYAANLVGRKPVEPIGVDKKLSAYEKARKVEALRVVLDHLNPPEGEHTMGTPTVGQVITPAPAPTMGMVSIPLNKRAPTPLTTTPTSAKDKD